MTTLRECADTAAAALAEKVRAAKGNIDAKAIADVIETVLNEATSEREEGARRRLDDLQASMQERLTRLFDASPAVIYSFKEQEGFKFHLNLQKRDKKDAIRILERILSRLKS
jgi:16S rRNA C967 or C1407 C5-methylase (RsmB/RsmF family)